MPAGKADVVHSFQKDGSTVAMAGDGINDSPALAAADVGMAIGAGTDIAIEAADYVLMRNNLEDVITAIDLSRKTFSRIRLNYVFTMAYNAVAILFPWLGITLPPWVAGTCMALSSISVVCFLLCMAFSSISVVCFLLCVALSSINGFDGTGNFNFVHCCMPSIAIVIVAVHSL